MNKEKTFEIEYLGFRIRNTWNSDGYVLFNHKVSWGSHLGNFNSLMEAKRNALFFYLLERPEHFASLIRTMTLYDNGHWGDFKVLERVMESEGIEMPEEITMSKDTNFSILFDGKPLYGKKD